MPCIVLPLCLAELTGEIAFRARANRHVERLTLNAESQTALEESHSATLKAAGLTKDDWRQEDNE